MVKPIPPLTNTNNNVVEIGMNGITISSWDLKISEMRKEILEFLQEKEIKEYLELMKTKRLISSAIG